MPGSAHLIRSVMDIFKPLDVNCAAVGGRCYFWEVQDFPHCDVPIG